MLLTQTRNYCRAHYVIRLKNQFETATSCVQVLHQTTAEQHNELVAGIMAAKKTTVTYYKTETYWSHTVESIAAVESYCTRIPKASR